MANITWIKLSVNLFDDEKIKLIRSMPEGDSILLIWIQLLCLAGKTNDEGSVYMGQHMYYTDEMLATICDVPLGVVRIALKTFHEFNMIDINSNGLIQIENWEKHQSTDKLSKIRKQGRDRKRKYDLRKALREYGVDPDGEDIPSNLDDLEEYVNNVSVTLRNETEVRSKKLEDRSKKLEDRSKKLEVNYPFSEVVDYLNEKADKSYKHTTSKTKELIKSRINEGFSLDDFKKVIDNKVIDWKGDSKMEKFLRPETLFSNKFESYLNENPKPKKMQGYLKPYDDEKTKKYIENKLKSADFMPRRD